jgi:outer membrane protein TolC
MALFILAGGSGPGLGGPITGNVFPIDLNTALRLAVLHNPRMRLAREHLIEARAKHDTALDEFLPWVSSSAKFFKQPERYQAPDGSFYVVRRDYDATASFAAQMTLGDAIYNSLSAKQLVAASSGALAAERQDITLHAADAYFDLVEAAAGVKVIQEASAHAEGEHFKASLDRALEQQHQASARLVELLLLQPDVELAPQDTDLRPITLINTNASLDALVRQALDFRPELKQNQALFSAAQATEAGALYGSLIPTLGAQLFGGGLGALTGGAENGPVHFGQYGELMVGLSWKIGPGGLFDRRRIKASRTQAAEVEKTIQYIRQQIIRQVVESHDRMLWLQDQIKLAQQTVTAASKALPLESKPKQFGAGDVTEVLQAWQRLVRARSDYAAFLNQYDKAQFALSKAIGMVP